MEKHAYLIIAHNEFYILERLIKLLDDKRHDIYLHIDLKVKDFDFDYFQKLVKESNLYFIPRISVEWGDFSQITCELNLLKEAVKRKYSYYHLLSGVDLPLKSNTEIYSYFEKNKGVEYLAFKEQDILYRIKYYHFFVKKIRNSIPRKIIHKILLDIQKILHVNRLKNTDFLVKKGAQWFSITDDLAKFILTKEDFINKYFTRGICVDELFLQTIVYNSKFYDKVNKKENDEHKNIKRCIDWNRGEPYVFTIEDKDFLFNSDMFFARKFQTDTKEKKEIVDYIYDTLMKNKEKS